LEKRGGLVAFDDDRARFCDAVTVELIDMVPYPSWLRIDWARSRPGAMSTSVSDSELGDDVCG
jgi:hypothetical protein